MSFLTEQQLMEKWSPVLDHADMPSIGDSYKKRVTAVLLENQEAQIRADRQMLNEIATTSGATGVAANYDPILIGLVRRSMPQLMAYDMLGVQPMTGPSGLIFALKSKYVQADGTEALFNEADTDFSGAGTGTGNAASYTGTGPNSGVGIAGHTANGTDHAGTNPVDDTTGLDASWGSGAGNGSYKTGKAMPTAAAEVLTPVEMSFSIEKMTVTAGSRALKAEYTIELQQDLKAVHGLDAESELSNILSTEITAEINREVVRTMYSVAKVGCTSGTVAAGKFDLDVDANGRWSVERFKGLMFQIEREANRIGQLTRRGRGNFLVVSADVASALSMTGMLDTKFGGSQALNVDDTSTTFAGTLNGKFKVYVDPYTANGSNNQFIMVGYRGTSPYDAGMFYCPYVPLQLLRAVDPTTFQPKIGFKTRYGLVNHPMAVSSVAHNLARNSNNYFRMFRVENLG